MSGISKTSNPKDDLNRTPTSLEMEDHIPLMNLWKADKYFNLDGTLTQKTKNGDT
jgi:hypothetical protein